MNRVLEQIYREHRQGLYSLALSITRSHSLAEDSIQNAFTRLFTRANPESDLVPYVFKSVRNSAIDLVRNRQRRSRLNESLFESNEDLDLKANPHETLVVQERTTILQEAIDELDEREREAVVLKSLADLTFEQVGEITGTSPKTIATRYRRALKKLEEKLKGQL